MIFVAASDSTAEDKARADFVCDGTDDQEEINAAIASLGGDPGTVHLLAGNYQLTRDPSVFERPTAIAIQQSGVTLEGDGYDTALWLGDNQYCNMIRSVGDGLDHIYVQDLRLYGNRANNAHPTDPLAWVETNAVCLRTTGANLNHDLGVDRIWAEESRGLNVFIGGNEVYVRNSVFGDATADVVELASGSVGEISNNVANIRTTTGHVFGTDHFNNVTIIGNTTHVYDGGTVTQGIHRLWPGSYFNQIVDNQLIIDAGGYVERAIAALGYLNLVEGNVITAEDSRTKVLVNGSTLIDSNFFQNVDIVFDDPVWFYQPANPDGWAISISNNLGDDVTIVPGLSNVFLENNNFVGQTPPVAPVDGPGGSNDGPTKFVAASDSSTAEKALADFVCDGIGDQEEINLAIVSLGGDPGTVHLFAGNYQLARDPSLSEPTSIAIQQSGVTLEGSGYATALWLEDGQYSNMIRSIGDGLENIYIHDMRLDANRANNTDASDPSTWIETSSIHLESTGANRNHDLGVERIWAEESAGYNVYIAGDDVYVRDSEFGDGSLGVVELADGSTGVISGNIARIDGGTGNVFGANGFANATIIGNTTHLYAQGLVSGAVFRLQEGSDGSQIVFNKLFIEPGGVAERAVAALSFDNLVTGNMIVTAGAPTRVLVNGDTLVTGNYFQNLAIVFDDPDPLYQPSNPDDLPITFSDNLGAILSVPLILPGFVTFESNHFITSHAPVLTSDGGGATATLYVFEGATAVTTVTSEDQNPGSTLTYSVFSGGDQDRFEIDPVTGVLSFKVAPLLATPTDADGNSSYVVAIRVTDGASVDSQIVTVNVGGILVGDTFDNTLTGGPGHDQIDGLGGADLMIGLGGDDYYYVDALNDAVIEGLGGGSDRVMASLSYTLTATQEIEKLTTADNAATVAIDLTGNEFDNTIFGNAGANAIDGRGGADVLLGLEGDDFYFVDSASDSVFESVDGGFDRILAAVSFALIAGQEIEKLTTSDSASTVAVNLTGNEFDNTIFGNAGANAIDGRGGADILLGLEGDDFYFVDSASNSVFEAVGGGSDRVFAAVSYALAAGQHIEKLTTSNNSSTVAINLTGNERDDSIFGNAGANTLNGLGGADELLGLEGDDFYFVDNAGDAVFEAAGGGSDRVLAAVSYALTAGQEVEKLTTTDNAATAAIDLTGNDVGNTIFGNAGANALDGLGGADILLGLQGDDRYFVDSLADVVIEAAGQGQDQVFASANYALQAGSEIERLSTTNALGLTAIDLAGNEFANTLTGNDGANVLDGRGGVDAMAGRGGSDWYFVDNANDVVVEGAGQGSLDRLFASTSYTLGAGVEIEIFSSTLHDGTTSLNFTGNELANTIFGNAGSNALNGKLGNDSFVGMGGADTFVFDSALSATANVDAIVDFNVADDHIQLARTIFSALPAGAFGAASFFAGAAAHDADDRVIYNGATGALLYDADGTGATAAIQFAALSTGLALDNTHLLIV